MKLKIFLIIIFLAVILIILFFWKNKTVSDSGKFNSVCFNNQCFNVEIASSFAAQAKGLMFRENLAPANGILFIFPNENKYAFWMKNTLIPLDIIWLDKNEKVVYIAKNIQPCKVSDCPSVSPDKEARYVLELNARKADEIGLKTGDKFEFNLR